MHSSYLRLSREFAVCLIGLSALVACNGGGSSSTADAGDLPNDSAPPTDSTPSGDSAAGGALYHLENAGIGCESASGPSTTARVGRDCVGNVRVVYASPFDEPITLTAENLPSGVTAEIRPVNSGGLIPSSTYASVTIRVRGAAAAGPIQPTIKAMTASHGSASLAVPLTVTSNPGFTLASVSAGNGTACGVDASGAAYCWGDNTYGELGIGTSGATGDYKRMKPTAVTGGLTFSRLAVGPDPRVTCGLTLQGKAYCWGNGWLGDGQFSQNRATPLAVAGDHTFIDLVAGVARCGLTSNGAVYCWGGGNGFLGDGTFNTGEIPTNISGSTTYKAIAASASATCALTTGGQAFCWGQNNSGELGDGTKTSRLSPTQVSTNLELASIAMSDSGVSCGLTQQGDAYCWGRNSSGGLGLGAFDNNDHLTPEPVSGGLKFTSLSGGSDGICGLDIGGAAYCWSFAGSETSTAVSAPTAIRGDLAFSQISVGRNSCGISTNGLAAVYCWGGGNSDGHLGTGDNETYKGPVPIASP